MATVSLTVKVFLSREQAEIVYKSLEQEVKTMKSKRTKADLTLDDEGVVLNLYSADLTAARAAANTLIRLTDTAAKTLEVLSSV